MWLDPASVSLYARDGGTPSDVQAFDGTHGTSFAAMRQRDLPSMKGYYA